MTGDMLSFAALGVEILLAMQRTNQKLRKSN